MSHLCPENKTTETSEHVAIHCVMAIIRESNTYGILSETLTTSTVVVAI